MKDKDSRHGYNMGICIPDTSHGISFAAGRKFIDK